jgi:hypothetical protein
MARRTLATIERPDPHLFIEDPEVPPDWKGLRFCRCHLREDDSVHVTSEELVADLRPTPDEDRSAEIIGEGRDV